MQVARHELPLLYLEDLTPEDALNLCVYRGGPHAVLESFVRGRSVYRSAEPELF